RYVREIRITGDVVAMRLGVDQVADRRLVLHALAPADRVDGLLWRVDHDISVACLDKARIATGEIDFRKRVWSDPAHRHLLFEVSPICRGYSAAAIAAGARRYRTRAPPAHSKLNSNNAATTTSTRSGLPASMIIPKGTGIIAPPSDMPELTKPNTLPIWPGGAASLTITSRGVRLAPVMTPARNSTPIVGNSARDTKPIRKSNAAAPTVRITTNGRRRAGRSATQPPTSSPPIIPSIYPVNTEEAASIASPRA